MAFTKPADLNLDFYELLVTENCNSRCTYCFDNHFANRINQPENSKAWAQVEMIPDILKFIEQTFSTKIRIHYIGGEPLLNFKFMKASAEAVKKRFGPEVEFSINTNIVSLDEEKINFLVDNRFHITTSIDGVKNIHNKNRGNWETVVRNLVTLNSAYVDKYGLDHKKIGVVYVVDADDDRVFEGYDLLRNLGISVQISHNYEAEWNEEQFDRYKAQFIRIITRYPIETVGPMDRYIRNLVTDKNNFCVTHRNNVTINPQGKLFFCHRLTPKSYEFGDDYSNYYGDIWNGYVNEKYYETVGNIVNSVEAYPQCKGCEHARFCLGNCLGVQFDVHKDHTGINETLCKFIAFWHGLIEQSGIIRSENDKPTTC